MSNSTGTPATTERNSDDGNITTTSGSVYTNGGGIDEDVFRTFVLVAGIIGMFANGFVACILQTMTGAKKEKVNVLMLNQMLLDLFSCTMLSAVYATKLAKIYLTSTWGYALCVLFVSETPIWIGLNGSTANLVIIAVERYLMIVHPIWHKHHVRTWMIRTAMAFTWFDGVALNVPLFVITSNIADGQCLAISFWSTPQASQIYSIWYFFFSYVLALVAFIFCYGRILAMVIRQAAAFKAASHAVATTAAQLNAHRIKVNIIKTMITITALFILCWLPNSLFYFVVTINPFLYNGIAYQLSLLLAFLNVCLNPFIYAGQYDIIRRRLKELRVHIGRLSHRATTQLQGHSLSAVHPSTSAQLNGTLATTTGSHQFPEAGIQAHTYSA